MQLSVPADLALEARENLLQASIVGSPEVANSGANAKLDSNLLTLTREIEDSGNVAVPWSVKGAGKLLLSTGTLIEQSKQYLLVLELARGKVNQVRSQTADWVMNGLQQTAALSQHIKDATRAFTRAVSRQETDEYVAHANQALVLACEAADELIHNYTQQVFNFRQRSESSLNTLLACQLTNALPEGELEAALQKTFNSISIPFNIADKSSFQGEHQWEQCDKIMVWARNQDLAVIGGPVINFASKALPNWLTLYDNDRNGLAAALGDYVTATISRYRDDIKSWQITSASNLSGDLKLSDEELLWLTLHIGEAAKQAAPEIELCIGISQPWGEYLQADGHDYSPFIFADTLLRSGLSIAAIDLEIVMGVSPTGSYCRDLLEFSRLLDLYALLGVPLRVTLGYPANDGDDQLAEVGQSTDAGYWRGNHNPHNQSDWAAEFATLAICKPFVRRVQWTHLSDAAPHMFPNCGLIDADGNPRPALQRLRQIREKYLL